MKLGPGEERERKTRKKRIDPRLKAAGWPLATGEPLPQEPCRLEEVVTEAGQPSDYVLFLDGRPVAIVEAKRVGTGSPEDLGQAGRYARDIPGGRKSFRGYNVPFLYATNGELIWFYDVRHELNLSRKVPAFHTPWALRELMGRDLDTACRNLQAMPNDHELIRPYQVEANTAIERAIVERRRAMLLAMATGTGKTFTMVNEIYRLMKAGVAERVLFLVDRRALAAQAVRAFSSFEAEPGKKFDQVYEVYSSRFQREDFGEDEKFDLKVLPNNYLTDPRPGRTFVYICTIQRMAMNVLGRQAIFSTHEEAVDEDADRLDIPIHAFDVVVADECHRGYTAQEEAVWRETLNHFDAMKIGLTATPAAHTTSYFTKLVYRYGYEEAVRDGYLVDYEPVTIRSEIRMKGIFLKEGERVDVVDRETGATRLEMLEDERQIETTDIERLATAPDSNRKILEEVHKYALEHEREHGRYPKTLIFAVNDLPHTGHADQLTAFCREICGRGEEFVTKITGRADRPLQRIREFRNRPKPGIAVTVDLLTTGVDIPDLEFIVLLRPVKSRILFEQMLGRGTRKGERFPDKAYFTVFDCLNGTIMEYFRKVTGITAEAPVPAIRSLPEIVEDIWNNNDRDYNVRCLVKRLHRIDRTITGEGRELMARYVPDGDLGAFARELPKAIDREFTPTMKLLRTKAFLEALATYPRAHQGFYVAIEAQDDVSSAQTFRDADGKVFKPDDYLSAFSRYVRENPEKIRAIGILLERPKEWSPAALAELRTKLKQSRHHFTPENLSRAYKLRYNQPDVDLISMIKHAASEAEPLRTAESRVGVRLGTRSS